MEGQLKPHSQKPRHSIFEALDRNQRRVLLAAERRARKSGQWPPWERIQRPKPATGGGGWLSEVESVWRNGVFAVLRRRLPDETLHFAIASLSQERPTWWEAQRIKNELAGESATAVEVYPPQAEVVDAADMYHLWVLPAPLPFSLFSRAGGRDG